MKPSTARRLRSRSSNLGNWYDVELRCCWNNRVVGRRGCRGEASGLRGDRGVVERPLPEDQMLGGHGEAE